MPQSIFPISPVQIAAANINYGWADINLSTWLPAGATGAIVYLYNSDPGVRPWGVRMKGSTDNRALDMSGNTHCWGIVGVDANRIIQFNNTHAFPAKCGMYLVGYTIAGVTLIANGIDVSPAVGAWTVVDLSVNIPAGSVGAIIECVGLGGVGLPHAYGARMNGSGDNRFAAAGNLRNQFTAIIGVDANRRVELYRGHANFRFYLLGYITQGATFYLNAVDITPGALSAWETLPALPANSVMGFVEINNNWGAGPNTLRENPGGWSGNPVMIDEAVAHPWCLVKCSPAWLLDGFRGSAMTTFFLTGYAHFMPPTAQTNPASGVS